MTIISLAETTSAHEGFGQNIPQVIGQQKNNAFLNVPFILMESVNSGQTWAMEV